MGYTKSLKKQISSLSTPEKIGQLLMLDIRFWGKNPSDESPVPFTECTAEVANLVNKYAIGGFALFRENCHSKNQLRSLISDLQSNSKIPMIVGIDQEGGIVTRLEDGTDMPGNMCLGAANDESLTNKVANVIGNELKALGINLNYAPVIDVNSNQSNPIIGIRAFSDSPELVASHGNAYIKGLENAEIIPCVKHFPGHGNTNSDTHLGLASVDYSIEDVENIDLYPFKTAFEFGVESLMAAHVSVPALDNSTVKSLKSGKEFTVPTTFSRKILTTLLREKMNFKGVVLTDALDMKAISENFAPDESVIKSIIAGADMAVMPIRIWQEHDIPKLDKLIKSLVSEYNSNREFSDRVNESLERIINLKEKYGLLDKDKSGIKEQSIEIVGCKEHKMVEQEASERGITLLKNSNSTLPITSKAKANVLLLDSIESRISAFTNEFNRINGNENGEVSVESKVVDSDSIFTSELQEYICKFDHIIIFSYNTNTKKNLYENICSFCSRQGIKTIVISTRNPYDIAAIPSCSANLLIYGASGFDQTNYKQASLDVNIKTAARCIFHTCSDNEQCVFPGGKLPVNIYDIEKNDLLYKRGYGLNYKN